MKEKKQKKMYTMNELLMFEALCGMSLTKKDEEIVQEVNTFLNLIHAKGRSKVRKDILG